MGTLSMGAGFDAGADKHVERLMGLYGSNHHFAASLEQRRSAWSNEGFQLWLQRIDDHYGDIIKSEVGNVEYIRVAAIEVIDGLGHYGFHLDRDHERKLICAVFWFDPDVFPRRVASDEFDESVKSVYTVLNDDEIIELVLSADWDALLHAGKVAMAGKMASVAHLKELLREGSTRSLSEGVL